jgi:hypothetical protein
VAFGAGFVMAFAGLAVVLANGLGRIFSNRFYCDFFGDGFCFGRSRRWPVPARLETALVATFLTGFLGAGFLDLEGTGMETPELQIKTNIPRWEPHEMELGKGETLGIRQARWANIWCAVSLRFSGESCADVTVGLAPEVPWSHLPKDMDFTESPLKLQAPQAVFLRAWE